MGAQLPPLTARELAVDLLREEELGLGAGEVALELLAQRAPRAEEHGLDGGDGRAHDLGDLGVAPSFELAHHQRRALVEGELAERALDVLGRVALVALRDGGLRRVLEELRLLRPSLGLAEALPADVVCDRDQPVLRRLRALAVLHRAERVQERRLRHILGVLRVSQHRERVAVDVTDVALVHPLELTVGGGGPRQERRHTYGTLGSPGTCGVATGKSRGSVGNSTVGAGTTGTGTGGGGSSGTGSWRAPASSTGSFGSGSTGFAAGVGAAAAAAAGAAAGSGVAAGTAAGGGATGVATGAAVTRRCARAGEPALGRVGRPSAGRALTARVLARAFACRGPTTGGIWGRSTWSGATSGSRLAGGSAIATPVTPTAEAVTATTRNLPRSVLQKPGSPKLEAMRRSAPLRPRAWRSTVEQSLHARVCARSRRRCASLSVSCSIRAQAASQPSCVLELLAHGPPGAEEQGLDRRLGHLERGRDLAVGTAFELAQDERLALFRASAGRARRGATRRDRFPPARPAPPRARPRPPAANGSRERGGTRCGRS